MNRRQVLGATLALAGTSGSGVLGPIPTNLYLFFNVVGH